LLGGSTKARTEGQRIPAAALESLLVRRIRDWLADPAAFLKYATYNATTQKRLIARAKDIADGDIDGLHTFMRSSIVRVQVYVDRIDITLDQDGVREHIDEVTGKTGPNETESEANRQVTTLSIPACLKRTGKELRIVVNDGSEPATPDSGLVRLLARANAIRDQLLADRTLTFEDIAKTEGVVPSYATRLFRLTVLAPDIASAILSANIGLN
jgi:site-specific DNA recombinase